MARTKKVAKKKVAKKKVAKKKVAKKKVAKKKVAKKKVAKKKVAKKKVAKKKVAKKKVAKKKVAEQKAAKHDAAPVRWRFKAGNSAFGIFIDDQHCWVGTENGDIYALDHDAQLQRHFELPSGCKCLVSDKHWLYAGCDDGNVYDLRDAPYVAYEVDSSVSLLWLDIHEGTLAVSDDEGNVTLVDHECERLWDMKSSGDSGWMVRCDDLGVYHGHGDGVTAYSWNNGDELWSRPTDGYVMFGWQERDVVYAATTGDQVARFSKKGAPQTIYRCDASVMSCAAANDGELVFAADLIDWLYCFNRAGERLWKLNSGCGAALSMQYHKGDLYIVTDDGWLACIDTSEAAIAAAQRGELPATVSLRAPKKAAGTRVRVTLDSASASDDGVLVECYREGGRLRVRPRSPGYDASMNVQFPRNIREEGAVYLVDELRDGSGFYRAYGSIKLVEGGTGTSARAKKKATKKKATKKKATKKKATKKKATKKVAKKKATKTKATKKKATKKKATKKKATKKNVAKKR